MGSVHASLQGKPLSDADLNSPVAQMVREIITANRVVIFSKSYCPFSSIAKVQFRKLNVPAYIVELDGRMDSGIIQSILRKITGSTTVPQCFIDGTFVGGGIDIKNMYEQGILQNFFR